MPGRPRARQAAFLESIKDACSGAESQAKWASPPTNCSPLVPGVKQGTRILYWHPDLPDHEEPGRSEEALNFGQRKKAETACGEGFEVQVWTAGQSPRIARLQSRSASKEPRPFSNGSDETGRVRAPQKNTTPHPTRDAARRARRRLRPFIKLSFSGSDKTPPSTAVHSRV